MASEGDRTGDVRHVRVEGVRPGSLYLYVVDGPYQPEQGHRFRSDRLLIDPYAKALTSTAAWDLAATCESGPPAGSHSDFPDASFTPKCVVIEDGFDWQGDKPPDVPLHQSIIYEMHPAGFTRHHSSKVRKPGTFRGMIEKIPYLKELGVTAVELLPVHEFTPWDRYRVNPSTGERLPNYWGYSTVAYFAPSSFYSSSETAGGQVTEFKEMVRAFHSAGIEIILDVVFNHTAEGGDDGPFFGFKGWENSVYYMLEQNKYIDLTGCQNTVNVNHPVVQDFILDCLRYWVSEMHVDGFRFDLASVLLRDHDGRIMQQPPVVSRIEEEPVLSGVKLIAEAWDAADGYAVGRFPGRRWAEWNDRYRDDVRRFWRGDPGARSALATRLSGSSDLYRAGGRSPLHSVNYVTSHDGFTLFDLNSYSERRNEANGEMGADGAAENLSCSYGVEGETLDINILAVRHRQVRNFLATVLLSQGVPMILAGDEMLRTQKGNNNAYCQDNETSWLDWNFSEEKTATINFLRRLISLRKDSAPIRFPGWREGSEIEWFEADGSDVEWELPRPTLALMISGVPPNGDFYLMFNNGEEPAEFVVPPPVGGAEWFLVIDTSHPAENTPAGPKCGVQGRSLVVLRSDS